jgi:hypothetical protein
MQGMDVRIPPAPLDELGPLARVVSRVVARRTAGERLHLFTTLGIHRRLFRVWLPFAGTMLLRTRLPRADVELLVLRTAYNCSSPYEFAQHVTIARQERLGAADVAAIAGGDLQSLTLRQRLLLRRQTSCTRPASSGRRPGGSSRRCSKPASCSSCACSSATTRCWQ